MNCPECVNIKVEMKRCFMCNKYYCPLWPSQCTHKKGEHKRFTPEEVKKFVLRRK